VEALAIVTILAVMQTFLFAFQVGQARVKYGIKAPAITGHADFERTFRIHQNTLEQLVLFVPSLWIFGHYVSDLVGAAIGLLFLIGRFVYRGAYLKDPATRSMGFMIGAIATIALMIGGLIGAVLAMVRA